jgi:predicted dehydrogenase
MPAHPGLVREVSERFSAEQLVSCGRVLIGRGDVLGPLSRQSYLFSATEPPAPLCALLDEAIAQEVDTAGFGAATGPTRLIEPARSAPGSSERPRDRPDTLLPVQPVPASHKRPVAVLGAGDYARTEIVPALRRAGLSLHTVADREPQIAALTATQEGFAFATTDANLAIRELPEGGLVIIATAHDSHAELAAAAVRAGHRVVVEKPPVVTAHDAELLLDVMGERPGALEVGFNRRYHPLSRKARARLAQESGPTTIVCVVKELSLEPDHWYFWPNQGTRITGNLCHWIDLAVFFLIDEPVPIAVNVSPAVAAVAGASFDEERVLSATFSDGSLLTIVATGRGDSTRGVQEQIAISRDGLTVELDDLWRMRVRRRGTVRSSRTLLRRKGHRDMYRAMLDRYSRGLPSIYPPRHLAVVSALQIAFSELVSSGGVEAEMPAWLEPRLLGLEQRDAAQLVRP